MSSCSKVPMSTVYDMGGVLGYGAVVVPGSEEPVHSAWEERVLGMMRQVRAAVQEPVTTWRTHLQSIDGIRYLTSTYWARWLDVIQNRALARGLITQAELEDRMERIANGSLSLHAPRPHGVARTACPPPKAELFGDGDPVRFVVGDLVRARNLFTPGHTRLPRYVRGHCGHIVRVNGWYQIEDPETSGLGLNPQPVYTVRFEATELWGEGAPRRDAVYAELWQGYLEPVSRSQDVTVRESIQGRTNDTA